MLQDLLLRSGPPLVFPEATMYATTGLPGVEMDKRIYFASSVFWRGSVGRWRDSDYSLNSPSLGPYEENFRLYLLGRTAFPTSAVMLINVSSRQTPTINVFTFPHGCRVGTCHLFYV